MYYKHQDTGTLTIVVTDVNDNPPSCVLDPPNTSVQMLETVAINTVVSHYIVIVLPPIR